MVRHALSNFAIGTDSPSVLHIMQQHTKTENAGKQMQASFPLLLDQVNHYIECVIQTLRLITKSVTECCLPLKSMKANDDSPRTLYLLRQLLHQNSCSFCFCFDAIDEIIQTIPGRRKQREIVDLMVLFFHTSLELLRTVSALQSDDEDMQRNMTMRSKRAKLQPTEYAVNKYLAQTLASIVKRLNWKVKQEGHAEILEGILFAILKHIGRLISGSVFGEHVAASDNPANISINPEPLPKEVLSAESRYVVQILYATLGDPERQKLVSQVLSEGRNSHTVFSRDRSADDSTASESNFSGALLQQWKNAFQDTLLQSTLGEDHPQSLRLPEPPEEMSIIEDTRVGGERYGKQWLLEKVFGLIGWDMVTSDLT